MIAQNIPPGLSRTFAFEQFKTFPKAVIKEARQESASLINLSNPPEILAYDIDKSAVALGKENAKKAGVKACIHFAEKSFHDMKLDTDHGILICNPPYGARLSEPADIKALCTHMGRLLRENPTWSFYVLTAYEQFESAFGKKADKKRKLFNGAIKADYFQFIGPRPKRVL